MINRLLLLLGIRKRCHDCLSVVPLRIWCQSLRVCWRCRLNGMCVVGDIIDNEQS